MRASLGWHRDRNGAVSTHGCDTRFARRTFRNFPAVFVLLTFSSLLATHSEPQQKPKLPRPRQLDQAISWQRDSATGEIRVISRSGTDAQNGSAAPDSSS